jgi:CHAD domain-containing protein
VQAAVASGVQRMLAHDPIVRLDLGSVGVHQMRVSTRRLRSDLKTFEVLVDPVWAEELRAELKWLADLLGGVRDLDVLRQRLQKAAAGFPPADRQAAARLVRRLVRQRSVRLRELHDGLESPRYLALVGRLVQAARDPHLAPTAEAPAKDVLPALVAGPWKKLRRDAKRILAEDGAVPDEHLHALRIRAKRARYASEAAARALPDAEPLAVAVAELQGVLGDQHDAVVAEVWLRNAVRAGCSRHQAMVAGLLVAAELEEAQRGRDEWRAVWEACDRKRLRAWLER